MDDRSQAEIRAELAKIGRARAVVKAAPEQLPGLIDEARAAGLTMSAIAELVGYEREYLYQLLKGAASSGSPGSSPHQ